MPDRFHKRTEIEGNKFKIPQYIFAEFRGIKFRELVWQEGDRLDIIAEQLWGDPNLWKALALFNDIGYFFEFRPGNTIRIPLDIQEVLARI